MNKIEKALELLARKIDEIKKTTNFPENTLDEIREVINE